MAFSRRFPKDKPGSPYAAWEEVYLTAQDEQVVEVKQRTANLKLMQECITDAKKVAEEQNLKDFQTDIINIAIALFEKRASHSVYWKEEEAKKRFDATNN